MWDRQDELFEDMVNEIRLIYIHGYIAIGMFLMSYFDANKEIYGAISSIGRSKVNSVSKDCSISSLAEK